MSDDYPLPSGEGYHWSPQQRDAAANAVLDAREAATLSMLEFVDREPRAISDLPPWSAASAGWLAAQPTIADRERELAELVEWLDGLIDKHLPADDDE